MKLRDEIPNLIAWVIALFVGSIVWVVVAYFVQHSWGDYVGIGLGVAVALIALRWWHINRNE